jgi:tetratricopeptide (TPR) repeat protein
MGVRSYSALGLLLILLSLNIHASAEIVLDPEHQFQFAEQYFQRGEYYRAIGEYERFIYFFPQSGMVPRAKYMIGLSYLRAERYKEAIQAFDSIIDEYRDTECAFKSYLGASKAYVLLKHYDMALATLNNLITIAPHQEFRDEAYYQKGWVYLEMGLWEKARRSFEEISARNRERYNLGQILLELNKRTPIKSKNPTVAGLFAIIPGAGHVYCDRKRDAFISFLLNGAMIYAAIEAFDHDLDGLGGIITLFELGFYTGNIYSAVNSAHKYNRDTKNRFLDYLKTHTKIGFSLLGPEKNTTYLETENGAHTCRKGGLLTITLCFTIKERAL